MDNAALAGFMGPPPHTSAGFGAGRRFAPSAMSASDFGMPEILPSTSMSPRDLLLHGASHPGTSDRDFSFAGDIYTAYLKRPYTT